MDESDGASGDVRAIFQQYSRQYPAEYKIRFYMDQAKQKLQIAQDDTYSQDMRSMIMCCETALDAVKAKDVDSLLEAYEAIHRYKLKYNMRTYKAAGVSARQSAIGQRNRRPGLSKRAVMLAIDHGCSTADEVRKFLFNNEELKDDWGDIGIDSEDDYFTLTDFDHKDKSGARPTKKLTSIRIPKIISELRSSD